MENLIFWWFVRICGEIFEEFWRNWFFVSRRLKNFHQSMTNWENEVMRPLWPPKSLIGQIWPQIKNLWPKLRMLPCLLGLLCSFLDQMAEQSTFTSTRAVCFAATNIAIGPCSSCSPTVYAGHGESSPTQGLIRYRHCGMILIPPWAQWQERSDRRI